MPPEMRMFLSSVSYVPEKRQIVAEFAGKGGKISKRYPFFPKMFFSLGGISHENFLDVLSRHDLRKVKVDFSGGTAVVFAATFSDLKKVNNLLISCFGVYSNLVEPERQFLLERRWSYFDSFSFEDGEPQALQGTEFPDISIGFFSAPLGETISDLLSSNRALAQEIMKRVVYSKMLKIPLLESEQEKGLEDIFLENVFFASGKSVPLGKAVQARPAKRPFGKAEIDFSRMVSLLCSMPFNNIGPETINCTCCAPSSLSEKNVLPSSLVKARFLREGFYFNSCSPHWAEKFHESHTCKEARDSRKAEYFLGAYPAGPFGRGEEENILLADALLLAEKGEASLVCEAGLMWCCTKNEGALSREIGLLKSMLFSLDSAIESESAGMVASHGLFFSQKARSSPGFFYRSLLKETVSSLLSSLPYALTNPKSRFFDFGICVAFEALNAGILRELEGVMAAENIPARSSGFSRLVVNADSLMGVIKRISLMYSLGRPFIAMKVNR